MVLNFLMNHVGIPMSDSVNQARAFEVLTGESGGAKTYHGSGGIVPLRAA